MPVLSIGEPDAMVLWYPTAVFMCRCQTDRIILVISTGFHNAASCSVCGKLFIIKRIRPDGTVDYDTAMPVKGPTM